MEEVYARCAGLDVHKDSVCACVRIRRNNKKVDVESGQFSTMTADLEHLRQWLRERKIRRVIIESTSVYWVPVWNVLKQTEWQFDLVLANPSQVKAEPGRKTDQQDCERLAELGQVGLVWKSFVPPLEIVELRELTRRRCQLQGERNRIVNRMEKLLQTMNCKLSSVVSSIVGKTGLLILNAIADGSSRPEYLAKMAQGKLRDKKRDLEAALHGIYTGHSRWMMRQLLDELSQLDERVAAGDERIRKAMAPHADLIRRLSTIPGISEIAAWTLIAEMGTDMSVFGSAGRAASWAGLAPGNKESAGKRKEACTLKGNRYLRRMLVQCAWAAARKKDCFLGALLNRLSAKRGRKKALVAVAHRLLVIAFYVIRDGEVYHELGGDYYDRRNPERTAARLAKRLAGIGYKVVKIDHADSQSPASSASLPANPKPKRLGRRPHGAPIPPDAATPDHCPKCAAWRIACIHAVPKPARKSRSAKPPNPLDPAT